MALYNAFRFNYSDLTGSSLVIYIGARTTNLLFIEPGKFSAAAFRLAAVRLPRRSRKNSTSPLARRSFARSMMDWLVLVTPTRKPSDPDVTRVVKLVRSTMTRLHAELGALD